MFKNIILTLQLLYCHLSAGQIANIKSTSDTCRPSFKEIHDFQIGDVFQYVEESTGFAGGIIGKTRITSKYTITDKSINADTIIYITIGTRRNDSWCEDGPVINPTCKPTSSSSSFTNTLIYIDSANHFLNKCKNELVCDFVSESRNWMQEQENGKFCSYIQVKTENDIHLKAVGGQNNIFNYNENDSLINIDVFNYEEIYAESLGKISANYFYFESSLTEYLQGYIKGEDTTGIITPDLNLIVSDIDVNSRNYFNLFPNPTDGLLFLNADAFHSASLKIEVMDISGQRLFTRNLSESNIDLTSLNTGIYFLKIFIDKNVIVKKVVIRR